MAIHTPEPPLVIRANYSEIFAANEISCATSGLSTATTGRAHKYVPSGRVGALLWPLLVLFIPIAGLLGSYSYHLMNLFGRPFLVAEVLAGSVVGFALHPALHIGKCRSAKVALVAALLAAAVCYGADNYREASRARPSYVAGLAKSKMGAPGMSAERALLAADKALSAKNYLQLWYADRGRNGVGIMSKRNNFRQFSGAKFWLLHFLEISLLAGFAMTVARLKPLLRFNEKQGRWYKKKNISQYDRTRLNELILMLRDGDWNEVGRFVHTTPPKRQQKGSINVFQAPGDDGALLNVLWWPGLKSSLIFEDKITAHELDRVLGRQND